MNKTKCVHCGNLFDVPQMQSRLLQDGVLASAIMKMPIVECPSCHTPHNSRVVGVAWNIRWVRHEPQPVNRIIIPTVAMPKM